MTCKAGGLQEQTELQLEIAFKEVFSSPAGKKVLAHLLQYTQVFSMDSFTGDSKTFYNIGQRDVGLYLLLRAGILDYKDICKSFQYDQEIEDLYGGMPNG